MIWRKAAAIGWRVGRLEGSPWKWMGLLVFAASAPLAAWAGSGLETGFVAGLVAITPGSGFVGPLSAIAIGLAAGILCYSACMFKARLGYDDSLDVVGVHGVGGVFGALATGIFASKAINPAGADGLLHGNPKQLGVQALAVVVTWVYSAVVTFVLLKLINALVGLRVTNDGEEAGLDVDQHGENAYGL